MSMGNRADYMGDTPAATVAKLAYNICRFSNIATAAEVARFVRTYTKDTKSIYELLFQKVRSIIFGQVERRH